MNTKWSVIAVNVYANMTMLPEEGINLTTALNSSTKTYTLCDITSSYVFTTNNIAATTNTSVAAGANR